jgi:hypothetical protein
MWIVPRGVAHVVDQLTVSPFTSVLSTAQVFPSLAADGPRAIGGSGLSAVMHAVRK